ncbi:GntR family transcriptional regulator [Streptomyces tsukubensis]|uniref:GntR family transcriptional regulator n=1 Tax=Streptomyces tsukubensis TaxID=83656 RepID=A0A1V4A4G0_9ACTN|nr:GntR family transcriptional regulator [Streptomyces tsukubensis]OON74684.1 GntR family transcriptional regulator [Streptomyces tsukubensis]QFR93043.1 FCD domain-containing protein [Streptomyces tsukubensis]
MTATAAPLGAVRERVLAGLRQDIVGGRLRPGDRLVERELAERYAVSRVPVREALRALISEGFVTLETPRRMVVRRLSPRDVGELFELREALEVHAAGLAAVRATPESLAELASLLALTADATAAADFDGLTEINARFHQRILAMADNTMLIAAMKPVEGRLRRPTRQTEEWAQLIDEHHVLYEAIAAGDAGRARSTALAHVRASRVATVRSLFGAAGADAPVP